MPRRKYPLEPLARLKENRAESKTRELAKAVSTREAAQKKREGAEADREASRAGARRILFEEQGLLAEGSLHVADLVRASTWEARVRAEDAEKTRTVDGSLAAEEKARAAEAEVKAVVARARAESEVVQRHRERWSAAMKKEEESREEEALAEIHRPKNSR
jgi:hypothetical protein